MQAYKNLGGNSNIVAYEYGNTHIAIQFATGRPYTYSYGKAGKAHVENMKLLADEGHRLNSYVNKNVRKLYE